MATLFVGALLVLAGVPLGAESAAGFFKHAQSAEARQDYDTAFDNYQKAYAKAPKNLQYRSALYRIRGTASATHVTKGRKLQEAGKDQEAIAEFLRAAEIDPGNEAAQQAIAQMRKKNGEAEPKADTSLPDTTGNQDDLESMGAPAELKPVSNEPLTLHMTEDTKVIYQAIGKAAGINILFDPDYTSKRITADLNNVSLLDALRIVGTISNT
ncbi:MAG: type II and III secretion system protein, partial [Terracidiphilus sp.]